MIPSLKVVSNAFAQAIVSLRWLIFDPLLGLYAYTKTVYYSFPEGNVGSLDRDYRKEITFFHKNFRIKSRMRLICEKIYTPCSKFAYPDQMPGY